MSKLKKYKLKNSSSAKKRFKITGSGKIKITQSGRRHNALHKSSEKRRTTSRSVVCSNGDRKLLTRALPCKRKQIRKLSKINDLLAVVC